MTAKCFHFVGIGLLMLAVVTGSLGGVARAVLCIDGDHLALELPHDGCRDVGDASGHDASGEGSLVNLPEGNCTDVPLELAGASPDRTGAAQTKLALLGSVPAAELVTLGWRICTAVAPGGRGCWAPFERAGPAQVFHLACLSAVLLTV